MKGTIQPGILLHGLSVDSLQRTSTLAEVWLGRLPICSMVNLLYSSEVNPDFDELFRQRILYLVGIDLFSQLIDVNYSPSFYKGFESLRICLSRKSLSVQFF
ncbi:hypothetical protein TNCT_343711 [Trichonephila clavata]|uniref:Uncharacterized protein n=1 Tax=Trichonephila clavata TaxID=2740835 RepID=A0A8X6HPA0_TRICU|nr:hypothetical protein TNCT_343711 [Trichonephila clavata]